jgi:hypothetical protein
MALGILAAVVIFGGMAYMLGWLIWAVWRS